MKDNENAPVIPCHRVVKSNGGIRGYSMGVEVKRACPTTILVLGYFSLC
jgi:O6-methylguanine-DNA--protein-cysteine methyltransferase